jgi:aconitate decarboxylase
MTQAVERLVRHVIDTGFEDLPPAAIEAAKKFCLDTLGVCVSGTSAPYAAEMRTAVSGWGDAPEATVLGLGHKLPASAAAMINAFHTHDQEYDCIHEPAVVHPMTTVQSAVLAHAERCGGISGQELILALVLGVDIATAIGMASRASLQFFRPATAGVFGVAAAVGKLAGLDHAALMDAFGLAYSQAAGSMQAHVEGGPALALQIGFAAMAGMRAVDLACASFPGPHDVLEGRFGYFRLYEGEWDLDPVWAELGRVWRITQVSHKPFPTGRATHGGIDGILQLRELEGLNADNVEHITLRAPSLIHKLVGRPLRPDMPVNYARLCFPYVGALALANGGIAVDDFQPERLGDRHILDLARRIEVVIDDNPDPNALRPQTVVARFTDGSVRAMEVPHTLGSPERPLTRAQYVDKFRRCLASSARPLPTNAAERVIGLVDRLEHLPDSNELIQALGPREP